MRSCVSPYRLSSSPPIPGPEEGGGAMRGSRGAKGWDVERVEARETCSDDDVIILPPTGIVIG